MRRWFWIVFVLLALCMSPAWAQDACSLPTRLTADIQGMVTFTDGRAVNVRAAPGTGADRIALLAEGTAFAILEGPACVDGIQWVRVQAGDTDGWATEGVDGVYFLAPFDPGAGFAPWNWQDFLATRSYNAGTPDPLALVLPATYAGDMPPLPVNLADALFADAANLNPQQAALLAQNGFVVVPGGVERFYQAYGGDDWTPWSGTADFDNLPTRGSAGYPYFITSDSMLWALYFAYTQLQQTLESGMFADAVIRMADMASGDAQLQYVMSIGTPLEAAARAALTYYTVVLLLFQDAPTYAATNIPNALSHIGASIVWDAQALVEQINAAQGQAAIPFLNGYVEDFTQYRPRGYYAGDPLLERYFRAMMWLGRITFVAAQDADTLIGLLVLRALRMSPDTLPEWAKVFDTLTFLIGDTDDLGPYDYTPLADGIYGPAMPLELLADPALLAQFRQQVTGLPAPRVNGLVLPADTDAADVPALTQGFRLMGQRFTFDAMILGQLFAPFVRDRAMPSALDVPTAFGSDLALGLVNDAGASAFPNYAPQMALMRGQISSLTPNDWRANLYSSWLWAVQPLWFRPNQNSYPPLMSTDAWRRRDLYAGLASYTELKHATVLYAKQATGFGGGGPPLLAYGYVEPNPLVFARIAAAIATLHQGLAQRGVPLTDDLADDSGNRDSAYAMQMLNIGSGLRDLAVKAAQFAEMARKELAGEPLTGDEYFAIQQFREFIQLFEATIGPSYPNDPDPVAVVTDVASNTTSGEVLLLGTGAVDYIFVVIPSPIGLQVARGGVFSFYEFIGQIRLRDDEWRALLASGGAPPRPAWIDTFFAP